MEAFLTVDGLISLLTLTVLEIVLGIDNIIFISIVSGKLPADQRKKARNNGLMIAFGSKIGDFVNSHPSIKILALAFLLMIGTLLVAGAFQYEIPKGYAYFAIAFSFLVELLNIKMEKNKKEPVKLRDRVN